MPSKHTISPEIISLVQHVELNRTGWWEKSNQRLVIAALWSAGNCLKQNQISHELRKMIGVGIEPDKLKSTLDQLCESNTIIQISSGEYQITQEKLDDFDKEVKSVRKNMQKVRTDFRDSLVEQGFKTRDADKMWNQFNNNLLIPLVREYGAKTYELLSGKTAEFEEIPRFAKFLDSLPSEQQISVRASVLKFFESKDLHNRTYVIRYLNAFFFIEASSLSATTLGDLTRTISQKPHFFVLVDTNFLFSILALHQNPSNEPATVLLDLIEEIRPYVDVELVVAPITIDEARYVLRNAQSSLQDISGHPNIASGALTAEISGMTRRYLEVVANTNRILSAHDYFEPYIVGLIEILRDKGVKLIDENIRASNQSEEFYRDFEGQKDYQKRRGVKSKDDFTLEHDILLWHYVREKRPPRSASLFDAKYWIVTIDFSLIGFDSFKRRSERDEPPVCLHPTSLIQLFQFWVPRSDKYEEAIFESLKLPFLFYSFDSEDERVTVEIIRSLENVTDSESLSVETARNIFLDKALRKKVSGETDPEKLTEYVKEQLLLEDDKLRDMIGEVNRQNDKLAEELRKSGQIIIESESRFSQATAREQHLQSQLMMVKKKQEEQNLQLDRMRYLPHFQFAKIVPFIIYSVVLILLMLFKNAFWNLGGKALIQYVVFSIGWLACVIVHVWLLDYWAMRHEVLGQLIEVKNFHNFRLKLLAVVGLGGITIGLLTNFLYDWIKDRI